MSSKLPVVLLKEAGSAYLGSLRARGSKVGSIRQLASKVQKLEEGFGPLFNLAALSIDDLNSFIEARLRDVKAPTVNCDLRTLRAVLRFCVASKQWPELTSMPVEIKEVRTSRRLPHVVTPAQIEALIWAAKEPADLAILIAVKTGLRHQEILHLQKADIDLTRRILSVKGKGDWTPKSWCEREVPIGDRLAEALEERMRSVPGPWLFPGYEGKARKSLFKHIAEAYTSVGIRDLSSRTGMHTLRRTWATDLLGAGVDIETVRQLGGWADLETVQRYITSTDERKRAAIAKLG